MQKKKSFVIVFLLFLIGVTTNSIKAFADNPDEQGIGFSVRPIFNSKQIDPSSGMFYLEMTPGEEQSVEVSIVSTQKAKVEVKINILDAFTSKSTQISYLSPDKIPNMDDTLKNPVSELVKSDVEAVTVENFEEKKVKFTVKALDQKVEGVKLGAIEFLRAEDKKDGPVASGVGVNLGIMLASSGDAFNIGENIEMPYVKPTIYNGQRQIVANLKNPDPYTIENLTLHATITDKKTGKKIKEKEVKGGSLAPNSNHDFAIDFGLAQIPSGSFHYTIEIKNDMKQWKLEKDFKISGALADELNSKSDYKIETPKWIKIVAIAQFIVVIILMIALIMRRKKLETMMKKRKVNRKSKKTKNSSRKGA